MFIAAVTFLPLFASLSGHVQSNKTVLEPIHKELSTQSVSAFLVAEAISDDIHRRCLSATDYSGCVQSNSGGSPEKTKDAASPADQPDPETCSSNGECVAQAGIDQLGLPKVVGWVYKYIPSINEVLYHYPTPYRVPHKGQPDRYVAIKRISHYYLSPVAATPGYYKEITPATTTCEPNYTGLRIWVDGVLKRETKPGQKCTTTSAKRQYVPAKPARPGGPRSKSWVEVIDCKDKTRARYPNGKLVGKWKKNIGPNYTRFCKSRAELEILDMSL